MSHDLQHGPDGLAIQKGPIRFWPPERSVTVAVSLLAGQTGLNSAGPFSHLV